MYSFRVGVKSREPALSCGALVGDDQVSLVGCLWWMNRTGRAGRGTLLPVQKTGLSSLPEEVFQNVRAAQCGAVELDLRASQGAVE